MSEKWLRIKTELEIMSIKLSVEAYYLLDALTSSGKNNMLNSLMLIAQFGLTGLGKFHSVCVTQTVCGALGEDYTAELLICFRVFQKFFQSIICPSTQSTMRSKLTFVICAKFEVCKFEKVLRDQTKWESSVKFTQICLL